MVIVNNSYIDKKSLQYYISLFNNGDSFTIYNIDEENWSNHCNLGNVSKVVFIINYKLYNEDELKKTIEEKINDILRGRINFTLIIYTEEVIENLPNNTSFPVFLISDKKRGTSGLGENIKLSTDELYLNVVILLNIIDSINDLQDTLQQNRFFVLSPAGICCPENQPLLKAEQIILSRFLVGNSDDFLIEFIDLPKQNKNKLREYYQRIDFGQYDEFSVNSFNIRLNELREKYFSGGYLEKLMKEVQVPVLNIQNEFSVGNFQKRLNNTYNKIGFDAKDLIFDSKYEFRATDEKIRNMISDFNEKEQADYEKSRIKNYLSFFGTIVVTLVVFLYFFTLPLLLLPVVLSVLAYVFFIFLPLKQYRKKVEELVHNINTILGSVANKYLTSDCNWIENHIRTILEKELDLINPKVSKLEEYLDNITPIKIWSLDNSILCLQEPEVNEIYGEDLAELENDLKSWSEKTFSLDIHKYPALVNDIKTRLKIVLDNFYINNKWWKISLSSLPVRLIPIKNKLSEDKFLFVFNIDSGTITKSNLNYHLYVPNDIYSGFDRSKLNLNGDNEISNRDLIVVCWIEYYTKI